MGEEMRDRVERLRRLFSEQRFEEALDLIGELGPAELQAIVRELVVEKDVPAPPVPARV